MTGWRRPVICIISVCISWSSTFKLYATEPEWTLYKPSNTGIPGDYVQTIYVGEDDRPWIAGYIPFWEEGGMARFDGDSWFTLSNVDYPEIASPRFNDIIQDQDGVMWIASEDGLLRYDPGADLLLRYDTNNSPMPTSEVFDIDVAPDGSIWMGLQGLVRYDPVAESWDVWTAANGLPWGQEFPTYSWVHSVAVAESPAGGYTVWFGSNAIGVATYEEGSFFWYGNDIPPDDPITPTGFVSRDPVDNLSNVWLMTNHGMARRSLDGSYEVSGYPAGLTTEVSAVFAFGDGRAGLGTYYGDVFLYNDGWNYLGNWGSGTHTYALAEDSSGAIWAGGIGGAALYEEGTWQRYRLTNTGMLGYWVETIDFDDAGNVYMNGNAAPGVGGFSIFDGQRWTCVNDYNYGLGPVWGQPSDDVVVLKARSNGLLALDVGVLGLQQWDGANYSSLNPDYHTFGLEEDTLGRLWSGNWGRLFLYEDGDVTMFDENNSEMLGFEVNSIVADQVQAGFVWVSTGLGIVHTNGIDWTVYPREMLDLTEWSIGHFITYAEPAGDGTLWVGTGLGLYHFDTTTLNYVVYTPANSALPSDEIDHLEITPDGSVFATTFDSDYPYPGGLTRFDGETWTTWTMTDSPLPHNQVWALTSRPVASGYELWVGTASEGIAVLSFTAAEADTNGDGVVDVIDLLGVLAAWGPCPTEGSCPEDIDGNGAVDVVDLLTVIANWG